MKKQITGILLSLAAIGCSHSDSTIKDVGHARSMGERLADAQLQLRHAVALYGSDSKEAREADSLIIAINDSIESADPEAKSLFQEAYLERTRQLQPKAIRNEALGKELDDSALEALMLDEEVTILDPL